MDSGPVVIERERWLYRVADLLLPRFQSVAGITTYPKFRVSCGFPSTGKRSRRIGECWAPSASADATHEIFIHPAKADPVQVAAILTHELAHVVAGIPAKHGPAFKRLIRPLGLQGRACATVPGEVFTQLVAPILEQVGPYPHAVLGGDGISTRGPKQTTRMVKVHCTDCGYTIRLSRKWLDAGTPMCCNHSCDNYGAPMMVSLTHTED